MRGLADGGIDQLLGPEGEPRGDQTPWDLLNPSVARAYDSLISSPGWRNESRRMRPLPRSESCWLCDHNDPSQTTLVEHMLQAHPGKATFQPKVVISILKEVLPQKKTVVAFVLFCQLVKGTLLSGFD